jgi:hypothetical protein
LTVHSALATECLKDELAVADGEGCTPALKRALHSLQTLLKDRRLPSHSMRFEGHENDNEVEFHGNLPPYDLVRSAVENRP